MQLTTKHRTTAYTLFGYIIFALKYMHGRTFIHGKSSKSHHPPPPAKIPLDVTLYFNVVSVTSNDDPTRKDAITTTYCEVNGTSNVSMTYFGINPSVNGVQSRALLTSQTLNAKP